MRTPLRIVVGCMLVLATPAFLMWMRSVSLPHTVLSVRGDRITLRHRMTLVDATYRVVPRACIVRDGRPAHLHNLQVGDRIAFDAETDDGRRPQLTVIVAESTSKTGNGLH